MKPSCAAGIDRTWPLSAMTVLPALLLALLLLLTAATDLQAQSVGGTVVAWGEDNYGQTNVPSGLSGVTAIATGSGYHVVALKRDSTVVAWGHNAYGQTDVPVGLSNVTAIAAGDWHTVALTTNGTVVAWGWNAYGQTDAPDGLSGVTAISAGNSHTVALTSDGTVTAWGCNEQGQTDVPAGLSNVTAIAAGSAYTLALKNDGTVVAWGRIYNVSAYIDVTVPDGLSNVTAIAAGAYHTAALKSDGMMIAWGWNFAGQTNVPPGLSNVTAIAAGSGHTVALVSMARPSITSQPTNLIVNVTSTATFSVSATGTEPLAYQWRKGAVPVTGATRASLTLSNIQTNQAGIYTVVITNVWGSVTSSVAQLTVNPATLASITVLPANPTLVTGATQPFTAMGTFTDGSSRALLSGASSWMTGAAIPETSYALGGAFVGGKFFAIAGWNTARLGIYNPTNNRWTTGAPLPVDGLQYFGVAVLDGKIYVVGGHNPSSGQQRDTLYSYDPATNIWRTLAPMPLGARTGLGAAALNGKIFAVGGYSRGSASCLDRVEAYDPSSNTWSTQASMPTAHDYALVGAISGKLYVAGGADDSGLIAATHVYDPNLNTWSTTAPMPFMDGNGEGVVLNGKLYSVGSGPSPERRVFAYDPALNSWTSDFALMPTGRHNIGVAADETNNKIYAVGGYNGFFVAALEIFTSTPGESTWSSGNPTVARITADGLATVLAGGTSTISATVGDITGSTLLTVNRLSPSICNLGVRTSQFGFDITGTSNLVVVVEVCTNLVNPFWLPLVTNTLIDGTFIFGDSQWTNYPARFYRLRSP